MPAIVDHRPRPRFCRTKEYEEAAAASHDAAPLPRGDVDGVLQELRADFGRQYFVSGLVTDALYAEDCLFADPTVSFRGAAAGGPAAPCLEGCQPPSAAPWPARLSHAGMPCSRHASHFGRALRLTAPLLPHRAAGRELYKRNLSLLVPFFEEPAIQLRSLARLPTPAPGGSTRLRATWRLTCWLRLPWAPYIDIDGSTTYILNDDENQVRPRTTWVGKLEALLAHLTISATLAVLCLAACLPQIVSHVERWSVSATQALLLLLRPSDRAVWRRQRESGKGG